MRDRRNALKRVGDREIQRAVQDQTKVVNKNGNIIALPTVEGIRKTSSVIPV